MSKWSRWIEPGRRTSHSTCPPHSLLAQSPTRQVGIFPPSHISALQLVGCNGNPLFLPSILQPNNHMANVMRSWNVISPTRIDFFSHEIHLSERFIRRWGYADTFTHVFAERKTTNSTIKWACSTPVYSVTGSVHEFHKLIPILTRAQPDRDFVFEVVAPSIPGYGWSSAPHKPGFDQAHCARIFTTLMTDRLGFKKFYSQGGDWGSVITSMIGTLYPEKSAGCLRRRNSNVSSHRSFPSSTGFTESTWT